MTIWFLFALRKEEVTVQTKAERSKKTHHYEKKDDIP